VNKLVGTLLLLCVVVLMALALLSGLAVYSGGQKMALLARPPAHGTSFLIEPDLSRTSGDTNALASLKEVINLRFKKFGSRIFWKPMPGSRVLVLTPITAERELTAVTNLISCGGHLEFHLVHENNDQIISNNQPVPADYELLSHPETQPPAPPVVEKLVVKKQPETGLTGNIVQSANVSVDSMGQPSISFVLNPGSTATFAVVTRTNLHHRLAIVMDGRLYSAPMIATPVDTGRATIAGNFSRNEARQLANLLENPLPVPVRVVETKTF
jgi:SecD/SecF fusion protein